MINGTINRGSETVFGLVVMINTEKPTINNIIGNILFKFKAFSFHKVKKIALLVYCSAKEQIFGAWTVNALL